MLSSNLSSCCQDENVCAVPFSHWFKAEIAEGKLIKIHCINQHINKGLMI